MFTANIVHGRRKDTTRGDEQNQLSFRRLLGICTVESRKRKKEEEKTPSKYMWGKTGREERGGRSPSPHLRLETVRCADPTSALHLPSTRLMRARGISKVL